MTGDSETSKAALEAPAARLEHPRASRERSRATQDRPRGPKSHPRAVKNEPRDHKSDPRPPKRLFIDFRKLLIAELDGLPPTLGSAPKTTPGTINTPQRPLHSAPKSLKTMSVQLKIGKDQPDNAQNLRGLPEKGEGGGGARALRVLDNMETNEIK